MNYFANNIYVTHTHTKKKTLTEKHRKLISVENYFQRTQNNPKYEKLLRFENIFYEYTRRKKLSQTRIIILETYTLMHLKIKIMRHIITSFNAEFN